MAGITSIKIKESETDLEELLRSSRNLKKKERLQALYLLKAKHLKVQEIAQVVGKHRGTIHRWLAKYSPRTSLQRKNGRCLFLIC